MSKQEKKDTVSKNVATLVSLTVKDMGLNVSFSAHEEYAVWVRTLLQNWRQGTVGCKARSDVSYTNKKPWKQKGTGRARAGSARSPLWRGGGVVFGPQARVKTLKINKKSKKRVLAALICDYANRGVTYSLDWQLKEEKPSTALAYTAFKNAGLADKKITLFLNRDDVTHWMSIRNLPNVQALTFDDVNAYDLSLGSCIVVLKKDFDLFKTMVEKWN